MELILLLPVGKPPFIGVLFYRAEEAATANADLAIQHKRRNYWIVLETYKKHLNLRLICDEIVTVRFYNHLKYDPEQLKSWLYIVSANKSAQVNFSQLVVMNEKLSVVKTSPKNVSFVLKVKKCEVLKQSG